MKEEKERFLLVSKAGMYILKKALEFYADEKSYECVCVYGPGDRKEKRTVFDDNGKRARHALELLDKEMG